MPHRIVEATWLAPEVRRFVVEAPHVVRRCGPGQFVIVRVTADGERIPLTIAHADRSAKTVGLIVQAVGATTHAMCALAAGDQLADVAGPLGKATHIDHVGHAVIVGGGVGTAVIYPQAGALKSKNNQVSAIIGGRSKPYVILERELRAVCDAVYPCTDDGSYGFRGFVTQALEQYLESNRARHHVIYTCGPEPMMKRVADIAAARNIECQIAVERAMACGMGTCQSCCIRVKKPDPAQPPLPGRDWCYRLACTDGPVFRGTDLLW